MKETLCLWILLALKFDIPLSLAYIRLSNPNIVSLQSQHVANNFIIVPWTFIHYGSWLVFIKKIEQFHNTSMLYIYMIYFDILSMIIILEEIEVLKEEMIRTFLKTILFKLLQHILFIKTDSSVLIIICNVIQIFSFWKICWSTFSSLFIHKLCIMLVAVQLKFNAILYICICIK